MDHQFVFAYILRKKSAATKFISMFKVQFSISHVHGANVANMHYNANLVVKMSDEKLCILYFDLKHRLWVLFRTA